MTVAVILPAAPREGCRQAPMSGQLTDRSCVKLQRLDFPDRIDFCITATKAAANSAREVPMHRRLAPRIRPFPGCLAAVFAAMTAALPPAARANLLLDGGFESPQVPPDTPSFINSPYTTGQYCYEASSDCNADIPSNPTVAGNWQWSGDAVLIDVAAASNTPLYAPWAQAGQVGYGGAQVAGLQHFGGQENGAISQQFTAPNSGGYVVSWAAAGRDYFYQGPSGGHGVESYTVGLEDDQTLSTVASVTLTTTTASDFIAQSLNAVLSAGAIYTLTFRADTPADSGLFDETALIDNVSVDQVTSVPEPSSVALIGMALLALSATPVRRRNRR